MQFDQGNCNMIDFTYNSFAQNRCINTKIGELTNYNRLILKLCWFHPYCVSCNLIGPCTWVQHKLFSRFVSGLNVAFFYAISNFCNFLASLIISFMQFDYLAVSTLICLKRVAFSTKSRTTNIRFLETNFLLVFAW